ncbi:MAG: CDP-alcohol phosphatidyltransferase family protein [Parasporobacterium sp.]|nr:CDP-alcohol phosphatidyltransferase family protein [Parasporobacterium sp.]
MSYARILMVPAFILVYTNAKSFSENLWAVAIVALSAITDVFDGIIARKTGQVTDLGKILDPIADKAMQFSMLFCVCAKFPPVWILTGIYAVKEVVSLCFSGYLFTKGKNIDGAMWCGKLCTVVLYIVLMLLIIFPIMPRHLVRILIITSAAFMILAFVIYMSAYIKLLAELIREKSKEKKLP